MRVSVPKGAKIGSQMGEDWVPKGAKIGSQMGESEFWVFGCV